MNAECLTADKEKNTLYFFVKRLVLNGFNNINNNTRGVQVKPGLIILQA